MVRSKTFHNSTSQSSSNPSDDTTLLRAYKVHLEQVLHKNTPAHSESRIPNYTCIEDVIKANEVLMEVIVTVGFFCIVQQLLMENDRLRSGIESDEDGKYSLSSIAEKYGK